MPGVELSLWFSEFLLADPFPKRHALAGTNKEDVMAEYLYNDLGMEERGFVRLAATLTKNTAAASGEHYLTLTIEVR